MSLSATIECIKEEDPVEKSDDLFPLRDDLEQEIARVLDRMGPPPGKEAKTHISRLYEEEWQKCLEEYRELNLDVNSYIKRATTSIDFSRLPEISRRITLDSRRLGLKTAPVTNIRTSTTQFSRASSQLSAASPPGYRRMSSKVSSMSKASRAESITSQSTRSLRPSISHFRCALIDARLPKLEDLESSEDEESVFSDNVLANADIDPVTKLPRRRKRLKPGELCEQLFQRGLGDPREKTVWRDEPLPRDYFKQVALKKQPFYMEKLKGKSRVECDLANARAAAFCEQQMQKQLRTASANWRLKFQRFLEQRQEESENEEDLGLDEEHIILDEDMDFSMNQALENRPKFVDKDWVERIQNWIADVEKATAEKPKEKKRKLLDGTCDKRPKSLE